MSLLNSPLKEDVENLIGKSNQEYDQGNYIDSIKSLNEAWDKLPYPKVVFDDDFTLRKEKNVKSVKED